MLDSCPSDPIDYPFNWDQIDAGPSGVSSDMDEASLLDNKDDEGEWTEVRKQKAHRKRIAEKKRRATGLAQRTRKEAFAHAPPNLLAKKRPRSSEVVVPSPQTKRKNTQPSPAPRPIIAPARLPDPTSYSSRLREGGDELRDAEEEEIEEVEANSSVPWPTPLAGGLGDRRGRHTPSCSQSLGLLTQGSHSPGTTGILWRLASMRNWPPFARMTRSSPTSPGVGLGSRRDSSPARTGTPCLGQGDDRSHR